jgi:C4-dicarboxylate transporter, DctM subunit
MTLFLVAFFGFLLIGVPIVLVLGLSALVYVVAAGQASLLLAFPQRLIVGIDQFVLLTVPLFILAGAIMNVGGISARIIDLARAMVGGVRGGLGPVTALSSVFFAGVSGSATAEAAAMGSILIPGMKRQGYPTPYASALIAVASTLGPIIPPSIAMVVYGALSGTSIGALFIAGIVPGLMLGIGLMLHAAWFAHRHQLPRDARTSWRMFGAALVRALPILGLPVVIIGGIRWGIVTATEAAVVAVLYAAAVSGLFYRTLTLRRLLEALVASGIVTSGIMLVIAMASIVSFVFGIERIPERIVETLAGMTDQRWVIILMINIVLLVLGCFLEPIGAMIITLPILLQLAKTFDIDPTHLGVIVCMNLVIGMATPPVGLCLFIVSAIGRVSIEEVSRAVVPLITIAIGTLLLVSYWPDLVLFLPRRFGPG